MTQPPAAAKGFGHMAEPRDIEAAAAALADHPDFRVLRRLAERQPLPPPADAPVRRALFVDCEATGLDTTRDQIIELAAVPFDYTADGQVLAVREPFEAFQEPSCPITPEITALTGISLDMVAGRSIDLARLNGLVAGADLIVAHNSSYDRPMIERLCPASVTRPWACSLRDVPWSEEGCEGGKLGTIASFLGFFFDAHRATVDCRAGIEILARTLPRSGRTAMARLLETCGRDTWRIRADGAGYAHKERLRSRGYRWSSGMRCWFKDVDADEREAETAWLEREVLRTPVRVPPRRITAYTRYSVRAGANTWAADLGLAP